MIQMYSLATDITSKSFASGNWIDGEYMRALEDALQKYLDVPYVILTNSGTSALLAAYWVLRSETSTVSVDAYTFPATYQTARLLSYDVTLSKSLQQQGAGLNGGPLKTITHLFGQANGDIDAPSNLVIEDACQSFGAERSGRKVGTIGTIGCFSFYPTKSLHTCGHGGAFVTHDKDIYEAAKVFIESGRKNGKLTQSIALNLRMDEVRAEFLLQELVQYDQKNEIQRSIAKQFMQLVPGDQPYLQERPGDRHIYSVFNMLLDERDAFRTYMHNKGVQTMVYYDESVLPEEQRPHYADITNHIVAIPCRYSLTPQEVTTIKEALKGWFHNAHS